MRYLFLGLLLAVSLGVTIQESKAGALAIQKGSKVAFDYTLTVDGAVVDSSQGKKPLEYTQGDGKLIPGLTRQLEGLHAGDEKTIVVPPEEAYGKADPTALKEVAVSSLPPDIKLQVGLPLQARDANGRIFLMRVAQIKKDTVVMDLNHPLAGKTLTFKVKVVSVQ